MKLFHLSDLHLGKQACGRSLIEDQEDMLGKIVGHIRREAPGAVMIAGDIYDRPIPSEAAVALLDKFLYDISELKIPVLMISGNHDSAERLAFAGRILNRSGIYISPEINKENYGAVLKPVTLKDEYGEINFYLLPFVTPHAVRAARENCGAAAEITSYTDAVRTVIGDMAVNASDRNVLIAHQFVTGAPGCESDTVSVGGTDNVDASVFEPFDYVALGHLHGSQTVGRDTIRYCGTPLKYSFSEVKHRKSITAADIGEKGRIVISEIPLDEPLHDWTELKGSFNEVIGQRNDKDFIKVILTDDDVFDAVNKLRVYFPNLLQLDFDNRRTSLKYGSAAPENINSLSPTELYRDFYIARTGVEPNERQRKIISDIFEEIAEENK